MRALGDCFCCVFPANVPGRSASSAQSSASLDARGLRFPRVDPGEHPRELLASSMPCSSPSPADGLGDAFLSPSPANLSRRAETHAPPVVVTAYGLHLYHLPCRTRDPSPGVVAMLADSLGRMLTFRPSHIKALR